MSQVIRYLAAVDGGEGSEHVVEVAAGLVKALGGKAELHLVHVVSITAADIPAPLISYEAFLEDGREVLDAALEQAGARFDGAIVGHLVAGPADREILSLSAKIGASLVVVGTGEKSLPARILVGSVANEVVRHARCPVLVVRPNTNPVPVEIEPPCPACVDVQRKTERKQLWCDRHMAHHPRAHTHSELPASFALGSMLIRP